MCIRDRYKISSRMFYDLKRMDIIKKVSRILLAIISIACGVLFMLFCDYKKFFVLLSNSNSLSWLSSYYTYYFYTNASLFCIAGTLILLNYRIGIFVQIAASLMLVFTYDLSLIHICRCRRYAVCRSRWSPYH
eukprot:TRINITY_DN23092_c0_g2_i1.p1 TRINITY_DN23092_c0_g2~~TRINITY_DN23092_c0_g2_i1.p1  ORF type:complete len:133 (+),score=12.54 TRINITY_DN23092_c0_g2_i1:64-462(+)